MVKLSLDGQLLNDRFHLIVTSLQPTESPPGLMSVVSPVEKPIVREDGSERSSGPLCGKML